MIRQDPEVHLRDLAKKALDGGTWWPPAKFYTETFGPDAASLIAELNPQTVVHLLDVVAAARAFVEVGLCDEQATFKELATTLDTLDTRGQN